MKESKDPLIGTRAIFYHGCNTSWDNEICTILSVDGYFAENNGISYNVLFDLGSTTLSVSGDCLYPLITTQL